MRRLPSIRRRLWRRWKRIWARNFARVEHRSTEHLLLTSLHLYFVPTICVCVERAKIPSTPRRDDRYFDWRGMTIRWACAYTGAENSHGRTDEGTDFWASVFDSGRPGCEVCAEACEVRGRQDAHDRGCHGHGRHAEGGGTGGAFNCR